LTAAWTPCSKTIIQLSKHFILTHMATKLSLMHNYIPNARKAQHDAIKAQKKAIAMQWPF
jgi:hypothetical protein